MQVEGQLRERIPSSVSLLGGNALVPAGKHHGLKNDSVYLVNVLNGKTDQVPKPVVVEAVDYRSLKRSSHSRRRDIVERFPLHFHVISQPTVFVLFFRNSVTLQVYGMQARLLGLESKVSALRETHAVCRYMKPVETHAFRVPHGL